MQIMLIFKAQLFGDSTEAAQHLFWMQVHCSNCLRGWDEHIGRPLSITTVALPCLRERKSAHAPFLQDLYSRYETFDQLASTTMVMLPHAQGCTKEQVNART